MGFFDTPETDDPWLKRYSLFLKFEGQVFGGIIVVAYFLKRGVAWHDAGQPFTVTDISFSAYWDMILIIYTTFGIWITQASFDPVAVQAAPVLGHVGRQLLPRRRRVRPLLRWQRAQQGRDGLREGGLRQQAQHRQAPHRRAALVGMWAANLFFFKKCFGNYGLPYLANITPASTQYTSKVKQTELA